MMALLKRSPGRSCPLVEYSLDEEGLMIVHNDTDRWYCYIDMTPQAEALF